jgi:hypothetical protein
LLSEVLSELTLDLGCDVHRAPDDHAAAVERHGDRDYGDDEERRLDAVMRVSMRVGGNSPVETELLMSR